eukprot:TRINITY_DN9411_c0_g2_i1.p1 TRINITY_DN9411_c0_g2~~TRINITY_DN9411_c0_g2_i1.p1  ORF type:complete len:231 (+),score=27.69 TRINITY_DN9411_c0_g2_i1:111-803(+)
MFGHLQSTFLSSQSQRQKQKQGKEVPTKKVDDVSPNKSTRSVAFSPVSPSPSPPSSIHTSPAVESKSHSRSTSSTLPVVVEPEPPVSPAPTLDQNATDFILSIQPHAAFLSSTPSPASALHALLQNPRNEMILASSYQKNAEFVRLALQSQVLVVTLPQTRGNLTLNLSLEYPNRVSETSEGVRVVSHLVLDGCPCRVRADINLVTYKGTAVFTLLPFPLPLSLPPSISS